MATYKKGSDCCVGDERLRIELLNVRASSVPELISVASPIRYVKRSHPNTLITLQGTIKRTNLVRYLKGLRQFTVVSLSTLTTVCVINDLRIEIQFHIVPDCEICSDVLIGMNLIENTNFSVIINSHGAIFLHQPAIRHVMSRSDKFNNLNCDLTDQDLINRLIILLNKYENHVLNTEVLQIRLKDNDRYVERRPYRLSPVRRETVRSIIKELLEHKIIRERNSTNRAVYR